MEPYYERDGITIYNCDCREVGGFLVECSIDSIVTDPPYGLEFMGKEWDHGVPGEQFWKLFSEVCKPGAMLLAFGGTRKFHRLACAIEDAGWEIRDCINWLYGSGFPKSLDISKAIDAKLKTGGSGPKNLRKRDMGDAYRPHELAGSEGYGDGRMSRGADTDRDYKDAPPVTTPEALDWQGWGTALKPAWEPIIVAMKSLDGTFAANALKHGVAGLNIDGCRVPTDDNLNGGAYSGGERPTSAMGLTGEAGGTSSILEAGGGRLNPEQFKQPVGRFPANVIHDGSDEVLAGFPYSKSTGGSGEKSMGALGKTKYGKFALDKLGANAGGLGDEGSASRFFYCAKASSSERGSRPGKERPLFGESDAGFTNTHPTVKPLALMKYLLQLVSTPTGGLVLDPFMGSGSTLVAAKALGRKAIGIEINKEYCDIAVQRLAGT